MDITIGTDPELFVRDKTTKAFVSAHRYFPGTKHEPFAVRSGAVQVDGVAAEFNIEPASTSVDFQTRIHDVIGVMNTILKNQNEDFELIAAPTAIFDKAYFNTLPEVCRELGCSPDFDAWTGEPNQKPKTDEPFRTGAGHIHIGWLPDSDADITDDGYLGLCRDIVKNMDASLFIMSHAWDDDRKRRTLYGAKGAFRPKVYGLEYRVLSNAYLRDFSVQDWVFQASKRCAELMLSENTHIYKTQEAKKYLEMTKGSVSLTPQELRAYNSFLTSFGFEPLSDDVIEND